MGLVEITDIIMDTHEDPVLQEAIAVSGEQAAKTVETLRYNILKACTNVKKYFSLPVWAKEIECVFAQ